MVTMVDEIYDRQYQAGRSDLNAALASGARRLASSIGNAFEVLVNIEYQAPWKAKPTRARCN
jgi:hypothetical protein